MRVPAVGQRVKVGFDVEMPYAMLEHLKRQHFEYTGMVIESNPSDPAHTFRMTGDRLTPIRIVPIADILKVGKPSKAEKETKTVRSWSVPSSDGDKKYSVLFNAGNFSCECPGYQFRGSCKHIKMVRERYKL